MMQCNADASMYWQRACSGSAAQRSSPATWLAIRLPQMLLHSPRHPHVLPRANPTQQLRSRIAACQAMGRCQVGNGRARGAMLWTAPAYAKTARLATVSCLPAAATTAHLNTEYMLLYAHPGRQLRARCSSSTLCAHLPSRRSKVFPIISCTSQGAPVAG